MLQGCACLFSSNDVCECMLSVASSCKAYMARFELSKDQAGFA